MTFVQLITWAIFVIISFTRNAKCGELDTIEQLKIGFTNIDMNRMYHNAPVEVEYGAVPADIDGTHVRHGCGVFGHAIDKENEEVLDRFEF